MSRLAEEGTIPKVMKKIVQGGVRSGALKVRSKKKKKTVHECTEKDLSKKHSSEEPDFSSETESSEDGLLLKVMNLPSSSGSSISTSEDEERSIEREGGGMQVGGDDGDDEGIRLPLFKSWDPNLISPQKPLSKRPVQNRRDGVTSEGEAEVMSPPGVIKGATGKGKEAVEGDIGEGVGGLTGGVGEEVDEEEGDACEEQLVGSGEEVKEVTPKAAIVPTNVRKNRTKRKHGKCAEVADEMGGVGVGKDEGEGAVGEGKGDAGEGKDEGGELAGEGKGESLGGGRSGEGISAEGEQSVGSEEEKEEMVDVAPKAATVKKKKKSHRKKVDDEEEARTSLENLHRSEHTSYTDLCKMASGTNNDGVEAATIPTPPPIYEPPGRRTTRSQQGNLASTTVATQVLSTQVDKPSSKKRRHS